MGAGPHPQNFSFGRSGLGASEITLVTISQVLLRLLVSDSHLHNTDPSRGCSGDLAEGSTPGAIFLSGQMRSTLSDAS